jgi:hypothetical protein
MARKLRIVFSVVCGIVCMLLIALWARSYWWRDSIWRVTRRPSPVILLHTRFSSNSGTTSWVHENGLYSLSLQVARPDRWQYERGTAATYIPKKFQWHFSPSRRYLAIPHWFGVLVLALLCVFTSPLIRWRWIFSSWRFGLRTLLIATTLVAIVMGVAVAFR